MAEYTYILYRKKKEDMKKCHVLLSFYNLERLLIIHKTCEVYNKYPSNKKTNRIKIIIIIIIIIYNKEKRYGNIEHQTIGRQSCCRTCRS